MLILGCAYGRGDIWFSHREKAKTLREEVSVKFQNMSPYMVDELKRVEATVQYRLSKFCLRTSHTCIYTHKHMHVRIH